MTSAIRRVEARITRGAQVTVEVRMNRTAQMTGCVVHGVLPGVEQHEIIRGLRECFGSDERRLHRAILRSVARGKRSPFSVQSSVRGMFIWRKASK